MQDKHIVFLHHSEDRDLFINKVKYPKTIFHVGNNPQEGDIHIDPKYGMQSCFATWVLENYDNLPEYTILSQADPSEHVHEPLLAFDATLTGRWGSFCFARSLYDQYSLDWVKVNPIRTVAHEFGYGFHNDNNHFKFLYCFSPGEILFFHKNTLLEKPKSFYQKIIDIDLSNKFEEYNKQPLPPYAHIYLRKYHKELKSLSRKEQIETLTFHTKRPHSYIGFCYEALWFIFMADQKLFKLLEKSQACLGNKLYFDTRADKYNPYFKFEIPPYSDEDTLTKLQFLLLENDWFDWECPKYKKWRKTLVEKLLSDASKNNFDGEKILEVYKKIGYKHIAI